MIDELVMPVFAGLVESCRDAQGKIAPRVERVCRPAGGNRTGRVWLLFDARYLVLER